MLPATAVLVAVALASGAQLAHAGAIPLEDPPDVVVEATGFFTEVELGEPGHDPGLSLEFSSSAPDRYHLGTTRVVWLASDGEGNFGTASASVTVRDTTPPEFPDGLPGYAEYFTASGKRMPIEFGLPEATDAADVDVEVTSAPKPGHRFPLGNTTITITATDDSGNSASHELVVSVKRLAIGGLELTRTHDSVRAEWDRFGNHTSYAVSLEEGGSGVHSARVSGTSYTFSHLDPATDYDVQVHVHGDKRIKASAGISTLAKPFGIFYDFTSRDGWPSQEYYDGHGHTVVLNLTEGNPAPSLHAYYERDTGIDVNPRLPIIISFSNIFPDLSRTDLFLSFDYKSDHESDSPVHSRGYSYYSKDRPSNFQSEQVRIHPSPEWQTYTSHVSGATVQVVTGIVVGIDVHKDFFADGNTFYLDNFYLGTEPPFDAFQGGSAE